MRKLIVLAIIVALVVVFARNAGRFLVVQDLQPADAIVVLEGETDRRPALALQLFQQGYGRHVVLDATPQGRVYRWSLAEIAQQYIRTLPPEVAQSISVCPITGLSTLDETKELRRCVDAIGARSVLVVTSQYHTRRAFSIFHHNFPDRQVGVVGAVEPEQFGTRWWQHRQWAKVTLGEWERLVWWECVDRWR